jgi:hypothetical protein
LKKFLILPIHISFSYFLDIYISFLIEIGSEPPVIFEPLVRKFEYKDDRVCIVPQSSREQSNANNNSSSMFDHRSSLIRYFITSY